MVPEDSALRGGLGSIAHPVWRRRALNLGMCATLLLFAVVAMAALSENPTSLEGEDPKQEASEKIHKWFDEVQQTEAQVKKFQAEAAQKSVDELVELARVHDLLEALQAQVPVYTAPPQPEITWDYSKGPNGPANWGKLSPDFALCETGKSQSPINIELDLRAAELPSLAWQMPGNSPLQVRANRGGSIIEGREFYDGHTFEVEEMGGPTMNLGGQEYILQEFHFHTPSEHTVAGRHYDAEVQFVHIATGEAGEGQDAKDKQQPRRVIVSAFFQQVVDRIPSKFFVIFLAAAFLLRLSL